jgi:sec-independent protein translocase protein TatB
MFGIGTPEIIGIVLIILLIYGPDQLPQMIKKVVGFFRDIKNITDEVSNTVSKEIHRIERSVEIQEARNLIEQNKKLFSDESIKKITDGKTVDRKTTDESNE